MKIDDTERLCELFPIKKNYLYFHFAAEGPLPVPVKNAIFQVLEEQSHKGMMAVSKQFAVFEDIRQELSILFNSRRENFAFTKNTSEGILLALLTLDIKPDENYIVAGDAFPTTIRLMQNNCKGEMRKIKINAFQSIKDQLLTVIDQNRLNRYPNCNSRTTDHALMSKNPYFIMASIANPQHSNRVEMACFSASKLHEVSLLTLCSLSSIDCYKISGNHGGTAQVVDFCSNAKVAENQNRSFKAHLFCTWH